MAIPAQRFKYLDQETNVSVADFIQVKDNSIYTSVKSGADAVGAIAEDLLNNPLINDLKDSIDGVLASTPKELTDFADKVSASIKDVVDTLKLPIAALKSALNSLNKFKDKITGMVQSAINLGKKVLCPLTGILDFLFGLNKFASITKAMMAGMLFTAMNSINKKLCSSPNSSISGLLKIPTIGDVTTRLNSLGRSVLSGIAGDLKLNWSSNNIPKGAMGAANVIRYTKIASDANAIKAGVTTKQPSDFSGFISALSTDFNAAVNNISGALISSNIPSNTKKYLVDSLNSHLITMSSTDQNYRILNQLKVDTMNAPLINSTICRANLETADLDSKITLSYKDLINNTELDSIDPNTLTDPSDKASITYLQNVRAVALTNDQLMYSEKSLSGPLTVAPVAGMDAVLNNAVITENDTYKPNDLPETTSSYMDYSIAKTVPNPKHYDSFASAIADITNNHSSSNSNSNRSNGITTVSGDGITIKNNNSNTPDSTGNYDSRPGYADYQQKSDRVNSDGVPSLLEAPQESPYKATGIDWDAIENEG